MSTVIVSLSFEMYMHVSLNCTEWKLQRKKKQRTPYLTFFSQIGQDITFTTNRYVKHRILHVMRDADAILHVIKQAN